MMPANDSLGVSADGHHNNKDEQQHHQQQRTDFQGMEMPIPSDATQQVIKQLLKMGYFHHQNNQTTEGETKNASIATSNNNDPEEEDDHDDDDDNFEAFKQWEKDQAEPRSVYSWESDNCQVIPTRSHDRYYTHQGLVMAMVDQLHRTNGGGGRASIHNLCHALDIAYNNNIFFDSTTKDCVGATTSSSGLWTYLPPSVTLLIQQQGSGLQNGIGVELISDSYWEQLRKDIALEVTNKGSIHISDLCIRYSLPKDTLMKNVLTKLVVDEKKESPNASAVATLMDDSMRLVSITVCKDLQEQVIQYFATLTEPVQIAVECHTHSNWDVKQVIDWLQNSTILQGDVHIDPNTTTSQSAIYIPTIYSKQQEKAVLDFVAVNGYITSSHRSNGVSTGRMMCIVQETYPDATVLIDDDVIILESTFQQLHVGIQDFLSFSSSFAHHEALDLSEYLPAELVQSHIIPLVLEKIGILPRQGDVVAVVVEDQAFLVSNRFVQLITDDQVPILINDFAKIRALQIFQQTTMSNDDYDNIEEDGTVPKAGNRKGSYGGVDKSKSKRSGKDKRTSHKNTSGVVAKNRMMGELPLSHIANAIIHDYPSFLGQDVSTPIPDTVPWEGGNEDDDISGKEYGISKNSHLMVVFCRQAFYTESFRLQCERAIHAELDRLRSDRDSKARLSRKDTAAKIRNVQSSFEDVFVTLCFLIQSHVKFIVYATSNPATFNEASINIFQSELLQGPCADLTSRITQHCLFHDDEEQQNDIFSFTPIGSASGDDNGKGDKSSNGTTNGLSKNHVRQNDHLPSFCLPVETTSRLYTNPYLSCVPPREPLAVLRESFSGNAGILLSRQWILCGGGCYLGGSSTVHRDQNNDDDDVVVIVRPGHLDGFISHVETNCLTLCGLPFKKLDKKAEKNFLFCRKQQLTSNLVDCMFSTSPSSTTRSDTSTTTTTSIGTENEPEIDIDVAIAILEYTIMILFQQIRNLIVSGSLLRGPILKALVEDRKIPFPVGMILMKLNDTINSEHKYVNTIGLLLNLVKGCGLCRDITKYDTTAIEEYLAIGERERVVHKV
jgi:hypothetical protein